MAHTFGATNAVISGYWVVDSLLKDEYGTPTLGTATASTHRVWFEESKSDSRQVGGDTSSRTARIIGPYFASIKEGDIIEVTLDSVGSEETPDVENWKINSMDKLFGFVHKNSRHRRMEIYATIER